MGFSFLKWIHLKKCKIDATVRVFMVSILTSNEIYNKDEWFVDYYIFGEGESLPYKCIDDN